MNFLNFFLRKKIRTRFAPSPTGFLHVGGLRTALYAYLFARQNGGKFILRLEDTDQKRYVPEAAEAIFSGLKWAGIKYDEGPDIGGPFGPYVQSERLVLYKKYAEELVKKGRAYYCFCQDEELEKMRENQIAGKQMPKYDRRCLNLSEKEKKEKLKSGQPHVVRMKIPDGRKIEIEDIIRGKIVFDSREVDDQVILKSDGYPTYHLAVVVDDHLMEITHVTRTEEWLPSTPKHVLLYEFLGWKSPEWAHLPLVLNEDKTKMSKRKNDVALDAYIEKGYLPEAVINFLAFLGWNPGLPAKGEKEKEIYSMKELLKDFSLKKVHKAGAVFNVDKLDWINGYYIRALSLEKLTELAIPFLKKKGFEIGDKNYIQKIIALEKPRLKNIGEIGERVEFFFRNPEYEKNLLVWRDMEMNAISESLEISKKILLSVEKNHPTMKELEYLFFEEMKRLEIKDKGRLLWPLRVALSGLKASPSPFEIIEILGGKKSIERVDAALRILSL